MGLPGLELDDLPWLPFGEDPDGRDCVWEKAPAQEMPRVVPLAIHNEQHLGAGHRWEAWRDDPLPCPAQRFVVLHEATVFEHWAVADRHGRCLTSATPPYPASLMCDANVAKLEECRLHITAPVPTNVEWVGGESLLLPVTSPSTSHLLFEGLGTLAWFRQRKPALLAMIHLPRSFAELAERALGFAPVVHRREPEPSLFSEAQRRRAWRFERLIVPIYGFGMHPAMAHGFEAMASAPPLGGPDELLYVSRFDATHRRVLLNEDDVATTVERLGFQVMTCATVDEPTKLDAFARAKLVVGPLGAGLYNAVFSPPSTHVVALAAGMYIPHFLSSCISLRRQTYELFYGPEFLSYDPHDQHGRCNNFIIDVDGLERRLEHVCQERAA